MSKRRSEERCPHGGIAAAKLQIPKVIAEYSTAFDETFKLKSEVDLLKAEVQKQKDILTETKNHMYKYEQIIQDRNKYIDELKDQVQLKERQLHDEFKRYDCIINDHVEVEKKLINDVEKSTFYTRWFVISLFFMGLLLMFLM